MSRRVLALSWFGGLLCLGCGGEARDFGQPRQGEGDAGDTTSTVDAGALEAGPTAATTIDADVETTGARSSGQESTAFEDAGGALSTVTSSDDSTGVLPQEPTLDGPCDKGGLRACDVNDSKQTLVCSQGRWQSNGGCAKKFNCDPSEGACSEIIVGCTDATEGARYCRSGDELWECGRNLVSETLVESCEGNCVPDVRRPGALARNVATVRCKPTRFATMATTTTRMGAPYCANRPNAATALPTLRRIATTGTTTKTTIARPSAHHLRVVTG